MGGFFGGLLGAVNIIGGCALYLLMGKVAWKASGGAKWARTLIGGFFAGEFVGLFIYWRYFSPLLSQNSYSAINESGSFYFLSFFGIPVICAIVFAVLQMIKNSLDS